MNESLILGITGMGIGGIITFLVSRHFYLKDHNAMQTELERVIDKITSNMIDVTDANRRVEEKGGKIKYRQDSDKKIVSEHTKKFTIGATLEKDDKNDGENLSK